MNKCDGCVFEVKGKREDRKGRHIVVLVCDSEHWNKASCMPTYDFDETVWKEVAEKS